MGWRLIHWLIDRSKLVSRWRKKAPSTRKERERDRGKRLYEKRKGRRREEETRFLLDESAFQPSVPQTLLKYLRHAKRISITLYPRGCLSSVTPIKVHHHSLMHVNHLEKNIVSKGLLRKAHPNQHFFTLFLQWILIAPPPSQKIFGTSKHTPCHPCFPRYPGSRI